MSTLDGILKLLDKWPAWKRIRGSPERLDALEGRVAELERFLGDAPGDVCPFCHAREYHVESSAPMPGDLGDMGAIQRKMLCGKCGKGETLTITPK